MANILIIIAQHGFRDEEFDVPKRILEKKHHVEVASETRETAVGKLGMTYKPDLTIEEALSKIGSYDAVIFVGGPGAAHYFKNSTALSIASQAYNSGKLVAAICIAPSILANAGLLKNKKATSFPSESDNLEMKGAKYTNEDVTVDGRIVTANGPLVARQFGEMLLRMLG